ncbi:MAG: hypothetical protein MAG451_00630 [Anaerolineales bacterium]|nr:hypothetical protein [Anaerolineales bacterium]
MTTLELVELKARIERLEERVRRLAGDGQEVEPPKPGEPLDQEQLLAWLKAEGLVRDTTPEERRLAAEWDALPAEEKQAHVRLRDFQGNKPPQNGLFPSEILGFWEVLNSGIPLCTAWFLIRR